MAGRFEVVSDGPRSFAPGIGSAFIRRMFEVCPYNHYHLVRKERMVEHVMKCRKAYVRRFIEEGEMPLSVRCRHNIEHVVYTPEIQFHEERCTDPDFVRTYLINTDNEEEADAIAIATAIALSLTEQQERNQVEEVDGDSDAELYQTAKNDKDEEETDEEDLESGSNPMNYELEKEKYDFVEWNTLNLFWIMIIEEVHKC